jgi:Uma2 family endonuclease
MSTTETSIGVLPKIRDDLGDRQVFGYRYVRREGANGQETLEQVPLTLEDLLHPQEDYEIVQTTLHDQERTHLAELCRARLPVELKPQVVSDLRVDWGVAGIRSHAPDLAVFADVDRPLDPNAGTFHPISSGGRCLFVVEIVSPPSRVNDVVHKFREYHRVGVPLYVILDWEEEEKPRVLKAYRWTPKQYEPIPLDEGGRQLLEAPALLLGLRDNRLVCWDAVTGEELPYPGELNQTLANLKLRLRQLEEELGRRGSPPAPF